MLPENDVKEKNIKKKKVKVVTFCAWGSIGSILQSYALTKTLTDGGNECVLWLEEWSRTIFEVKINKLKDYVKWIHKKIYRGKFDSAYHKRMQFISTHMNVEYFQNVDVIKQRARENNDNIYLAGSDQIWNPDICYPMFFLDFVNNGKRVSYAASMGKTEIPLEKKAYIQNMLSKFDKISVREKVCVDVLQGLTDKEISVHIDPTFLIEPEMWRSLEKSYKVKTPYILLYMLYWDKQCKDKIIELKKRTGLPVYAICPDVSRVYADKYLYDVGVEEFLWLVDHAEYVVTSSFHGVAFSIIFQKKFAAVINPNSPSRIENILNVLELPLVKIDELDCPNIFQYDNVRANIERERQRSITFLKEAIG